MALDCCYEEMSRAFCEELEFSYFLGSLPERLDLDFHGEAHEKMWGLSPFWGWLETLTRKVSNTVSFLWFVFELISRFHGSSFSPLLFWQKALTAGGESIC